ncbi:MAG: hypothetical protein M3121_07890 [Chloroflexota bacterium]|nr:hypothetical protein [Chloroflexota bacterium]
MRHLRVMSYVLTAVGVALAVAAAVADLGAGVLLTGILLAWAGIVKIAVVAIWATIARLDDNRQPTRIEQMDRLDSVS